MTMRDQPRHDREWMTLPHLTGIVSRIPPPIPRTRLIGAGGVGKTRLVLSVTSELIDRFADCIVWIEFASLSNRVRVPATVARTIGIAP